MATTSASPPQIRSTKRHEKHRDNAQQQHSGNPEMKVEIKAATARGSKKARLRSLQKEREEADRLESLLFGNLEDSAAALFGEELEDEFPLSVTTSVAGAFIGEDELGCQLKALPSEKPGDEWRKPVWEDEEEAKATVKLSNTNRLRKLLKEGEGDTVSGVDYVARLRALHAKLNPGISWGTLPSKIRKRRHRDSDEEGDSGASSELEDEANEALLRNCDVIVKNKARLPQGLIEISRMRDANINEPSNAVVQSVEFHTNAQILLTAGFDKKLRFFQIDGKRNSKVQSIFLEDFPIRKASFVPDGSRVIATARRNFYYAYDMHGGGVEKIGPLVGREEKSLESFGISQDSKLIAFLGNEGYILLTSVRTKQLVGTLKMNGSVRALSFAANGNELVSSGGDGEVYHWDLRTRRCIHKEKDEGCIKSTALSVSPNSRLFATGSESGVVNVYARESFLGGSTRPAKVFLNLVTTIDNLKFNGDSQILAMASRMKKNALRLVHIPSSTVFYNWPTPKTPLQYVHSLDFSPGGGFLAVGNASGKVLLFRLRHYEQA
eukprot:c25214_g1_i1 orf=79-1731(+)